MGQKEIQESLIQELRKWQKLEAASSESAYKVAERTDNPVIKQVMEIIARDSETHKKVQEFIVRSMTEEAPVITPEDLANIWDGIEKHIQMEKKMVQSVREALEQLKGKYLVLQQYLLQYLLEDEQKHDHLLEGLRKIKEGMYPYGST